MSSQRLGFFSALSCFTIWGLLPLYFKLLGHVSPELMLAHRIVWALPTGLILIALAGNWRDLRAAITRQRLFWLLISSFVIAINWWVYIWAVGQDRVMEASLGYYINPLLNIVLGLIVFKERLRSAQWLAVAIAAIGVGIMTVALGRIPWVAIILALTFGVYSVVRKQLQVDSRVGFVLEVAVLYFPAVFWMGAQSEPIFAHGGWDIPLLIAAGPITAIPLILFALAAKRLALSTIGMMQYLGPTLQFLISLILGEAFGVTHALGFACIWMALIIFSLDGFRNEAKSRQLSAAGKT